MGQNLNSSLCSRKRSAHTRGSDTCSSSAGPGFQRLETGSRVSPARRVAVVCFPVGSSFFCEGRGQSGLRGPDRGEGWGAPRKAWELVPWEWGLAALPGLQRGLLILGLQAPLPHRGGPRAKRSAQGHREGLPGGQVALESWFLESGRSRTFSAAHPCGGAAASAGLEVLHPPPYLLCDLGQVILFLDLGFHVSKLKGEEQKSVS